MAFRIQYPNLYERILCAKTFISSFFQLEQEARRFWGGQKQGVVPYDPHYKGLMEILVDDQELMCGFSVHWPNESASTYRRTEIGVDMVNCFFDVENCISLMVGEYVRTPSDFSPLVEAGQQPVYTALDGSTEHPTWPGSI